MLGRFTGLRAICRACHRFARRRGHHGGRRRWRCGRLGRGGPCGRRLRRNRGGQDGLRYGPGRCPGWRRSGLRGRGRRGRDRLRRGLRRWRRGLRLGRRGGLRGRLRGTRRWWRRWRAAGVAVVPPAAAATTVSSVVGAVVRVSVRALLGAVMSTTRAASAAVAGSHRDHCGGGRAVAGVGRRVGAAISHGRRDGQGRPQQDRDRQQAPGTGSVHPGSMGPRPPRTRGSAPVRLNGWSADRKGLSQLRSSLRRVRSSSGQFPKGICRYRSFAPGAPPGAFGV